jgi:hypothetical protein
MEAVEAPMRQFLEWIAARPRTYAETMDAWRTSCPRLAVWEDAHEAGFVRLVASASGTVVTLTAEGLEAVT